MRRIIQGENLPDWFEARRWKNSETGSYIDNIEDFMVTEIDGRIVASAQITFSKYTQCYHLASLWVNKHFRGKKLGQELIRQLLLDTGANKVYMDTSKNGLTPYYEQCGFRIFDKNLYKFQQEFLMRYPNKEVENQIFMVCDL